MVPGGTMLLMEAAVSEVATPTARWRTPRSVARGLWVLTLTLVLAGAILLMLNLSIFRAGGIAGIVLILLTAMIYASVGGLIASRLPRNPIGWLLQAIGFVLALAAFVEQYGLRGLVTAPGSLPAVRV